MDYYNPSFALKEIEEAERKAEKRADRRHDWLVATYGIIGGAVAGGIVSAVIGCYYADDNRY